MARKTDGKEAYSVDLPKDAIEQWGAYCDRYGLHKWKATLAAFRLLQMVPADIRDQLMEGNYRGAEELFRVARIQMIQDEMNALMEQNLQASEGRQSDARRKAGGRKG